MFFRMANRIVYFNTHEPQLLLLEEASQRHELEQWQIQKALLLQLQAKHGAIVAKLNLNQPRIQKFNI